MERTAQYTEHLTGVHGLNLTQFTMSYVSSSGKIKLYWNSERTLSVSTNTNTVHLAVYGR